MKIDKRVEICIIATILLLVLMFFSLLGFIAWLFYMIVHCWWRYLGIKTILSLTTIIAILYLLVRYYKRLVREYRAERLQRYRIWRTFYMELRNEAYLRGARRRRQQAERAREIRRENNREFKQRMERLVEGGKMLDAKREQCIKEYKQALKTREDLEKKMTEKENQNSTSSKKIEAPKLLLRLMDERKEKMEKIIPRRDDERKKNLQETKEQNSAGHKVKTSNLPSIRATFLSFIDGVKRMEQTYKSYTGPKMYYMLYNIDYAITNVLFTIKELSNVGPSKPKTKQNDQKFLGMCKPATNMLNRESQFEKQQDKPDIHFVEEEIDHLLCTAHSKILLVRDRVLQGVINFDTEPSSTIATPDMMRTTNKIAQLDIQQIQNCFKQEDIVEAFHDLRDAILPKFRKCITRRMETDKMNSINMDRWERRFDEKMTKVHQRQSLTHLKVGNGYVGKIIVEKPLKEKDSLERTPSLWSYVQSDEPEKRKKKSRWLESFRRSNKDNGATYLAVGGAAVFITASYLVYRYIR